MTNNTVKAIYGFISRLKITKVSDKETRNAIIRLHLALHKAVEAIDNDIREVYNIHLGDKRDDYLSYAALVDKVRKGEANEGDLDPEMRALDALMGESINDILNGENKAEIEPVNEGGFIDALAEQGVEITCADLMELHPIFI